MVDLWSEEYFEQRRAECNRLWAEEHNAYYKAQRLNEYKLRKAEENFEIHL